MAAAAAAKAATGDSGPAVQAATGAVAPAASPKATGAAKPAAKIAELLGDSFQREGRRIAAGAVALLSEEALIRSTPPFLAGPVKGLSPNLVGAALLRVFRPVAVALAAVVAAASAVMSDTPTALATEEEPGRPTAAGLDSGAVASDADRRALALGNTSLVGKLPSHLTKASLHPYSKGARRQLAMKLSWYGPRARTAGS